MASQQYASPYGNLSLDTARAEFETLTARQRNLSREEPGVREGLQDEIGSEESDFLQGLINESIPCPSFVTARQWNI